MYNVISNQIGYKNLLERKGRKMKESIFAKAKKARENKKGFTLVELIVVLVILAILAAILVPALIGWIDKAKEKQIILNARNAYLACQTVVSEKYAVQKGNADISWDANMTKEAATISEVPEANIKTVTVTKNKVTGLLYEEDNKQAELKDGAWTVSKVSAP